MAPPDASSALRQYYHTKVETLVYVCTSGSSKRFLAKVQYDIRRRFGLRNGGKKDMFAQAFRMGKERAFTHRNLWCFMKDRQSNHHLKYSSFPIFPSQVVGAFIFCIQIGKWSPMSFIWIALFLKTPAEIFCRWMMIIRSHMATRLRQDLHQCLSLHLCCWSGGCAFVRSATSGRVEPTSGSRGSGAGRFGRWGDKETCGIMWPCPKMMYWSYPQNLLLDFTFFYENSYFCRVHSVLG